MPTRRDRGRETDEQRAPNSVCRRVLSDLQFTRKDRHTRFGGGGFGRKDESHRSVLLTCPLVDLDVLLLTVAVVCFLSRLSFVSGSASIHDGRK